MTLLTQRVNSLHSKLKLIKTVYSVSIPLTSLLKTRNPSSSLAGLINAQDQKQYNTLTFLDFQSVNEKGVGKSQKDTDASPAPHTMLVVDPFK